MSPYTVSSSTSWYIKSQAVGVSPRSKHTVPEGDLLGLDHQQVSDPDPAAQLDVSHVPNLSSPPAEEPSSLSLGQHPPPESSIAQSERIKREAQDLNDREVHERRRKHLARRVTGFATKPSGLQAGPPGGKHQNRARGGRGGSDYETASDREDEDDDETWVPDVFIFEYGTVVIWGMTEREEKRMLANLYVLFSFQRAFTHLPDVHFLSCTVVNSKVNV